MNPLVSIITPTFNSASTLPDTIRSVLSQTYEPIEHIIVDGGSTDRTHEVVRDLGREGVTKFKTEPDDGIYDAMNKGIRRASGDIVGIVNSDDFLASPDVIEAVVERFAAEDASIVYCDVQLVDQGDPTRVVRNWRPGTFDNRSFARGWHPPHPGVFVARELYDSYGAFRTDYRVAADFELLLRLFERARSIVSYLPIVAVRMRLGGASTRSLRNVLVGNRECVRAFRDNDMKVPLFYSLFRLVPKVRQFMHVRSQ